MVDVRLLDIRLLDVRLLLFAAELLQQNMEAFVAVFMNDVAELLQHGVNRLLREKSVIVEMAQTKEVILTSIYVHTAVFGTIGREEFAHDVLLVLVRVRELTQDANRPPSPSQTGPDPGSELP